MWKLWHLLFKWHYIHIKDGYRDHILKVQKSPNGEKFVKHERHIYFLQPEGNGRFKNNRGEYIPLTWSKPDESE